VTSSASRTTLLPDLPRSLLHHRLLDDVPDEHAQDTQLPGMFCSGSWPLTSSLARKRPSSSWVALSRAPNTSVPLATCTRDGQRLTHDCVGKDLALFPMRRGTNHRCQLFLFLIVRLITRCVGKHVGHEGLALLERDSVTQRLSCDGARWLL
jgi:hypothetical protein